jgi:hypothetical protein
MVLGCTQTVSQVTRDDLDAGTCRGVTPAALSRAGLELAPGEFTFRLPRVREPRVSFAPTAACPDPLHAPALLRWTPTRDAAVFVEDLHARGLRIAVLDDCDAAPRACVRTLGGLAQRAIAVYANRPVTLALAPIGLPDDPATRLADVDEIVVSLVIRDLARPYEPCEIVAPAGGAMCGEDARCESVCLPDREIGASCAVDTDCAGSLWCVAQQCSLPRLVTSSRACGAACDGGSRCEGGRCRFQTTEGEGCNADTVCQAPLDCVAGRCGRFTPRGGDCSLAPSTCAVGTTCRRTAEGVRCVDVEPPRCDAATPCAAGTRCIDGRCAGDGVCVSAQTYPRVPCGAAAGCVEPAESVSPPALPRCLRDGAAGGFCRATGAPCEEGAACSIGRCVAVVGEGASCAPWSALCGVGLHCGPFARCVRNGAPGAPGGVCLAGLRCNEGLRCDPDRGECVREVASGGPCESSTSCPSSEFCERGAQRCRARVGPGEPCSQGDACIAPRVCAGRCVAAPTMIRREGSPCASPADCRGGRCAEGSCRFELPPGARCEDGRACIEGFACGANDGQRRCLPIGN